jgi:hypothetical protein
MDIYFFDNTDPDGFDRVFDKIDNYLSQTLVVVVSKSGGTKETRNGMLEAESFYREGIKLDEKVYGPEHPNTFNDRMNLATVLQTDGKYSDAGVEYREVIKLEGKGGNLPKPKQSAVRLSILKTRVLGPDNLVTLNSRGNLAIALLGQGKFAEPNIRMC